MVYGIQFFKTLSGLDLLNLYAFQTKLERDIWINADPVVINNSGSRANGKYARKTCDRSDAETLLKYGFKPIKITATVNRENNPLKKDGYQYVYVYPSAPAQGKRGQSSQLGVMIRFNHRRETRAFLEEFKNVRGVCLKQVNGDHPLARYFKINGLLLDQKRINREAALNLLRAIASFDALNPSKSFLCLVCHNDWSSPSIFSFHRKSSRDLFMTRLNKRGKHKYKALRLSNFCQIAFYAIVTKSIYKGSVVNSLKRVDALFGSDEANARLA